MSDERQKSSGEYAWLHELKTDNLYGLLDDTSLDSNSDSQYLDAILSEIVSRDDYEPVDTDSAWRELRQLIAEEEQEESIGPGQRKLTGIAPEIKTQTKAISPDRNQGRRRVFRFRYLLVAVLVLAMLFSVAVGAGAFPGVKKAFQQWTDEVFMFTDNPSPIPGVDVGYSDFAQFLSANGIVERLAPTKFPDGYVLTFMEVADEESNTKFFATYENDSGEGIIITIINDSEWNVISEKDANVIVKHDVNGITHYIMNNNIRKKAVWINAQYECTISVPVETSDEDIINIINSIYER